MTTKAANRVIENILRINLRIRKRDRLLVFTDDVDPQLNKIAKDIRKRATMFSPTVEHALIKASGYHGVEPPAPLWKKAFGVSTVSELEKTKLLPPLLQKKLTDRELKNVEKIVSNSRKHAVTAVIALSYYSTSHTRFRDLLTRCCKARYASMPIFDKFMLTGAMMVDWEEMEKRTGAIARRIRPYESIEIETPNGTSMRLSRKGRKVLIDTGMITRPGSFSNLPAGEVFLAPLEGTAEGTLVLEWAPTRALKSPVTLTIRKGRVTKVEGKEEFTSFLRKKLDESGKNGNIAELGIGTNDKATRADNILESEKILGTIHIALGDNSSFGGTVRTPFHQDFVFFQPTVTLISATGKRKPLLVRGKLVAIS